EGRPQDAKIGKLADLHGADITRNALSNRRIDCVLRDIASGSEIVVVALLVGQSTELLLHLVRRLPGADDHFSYATHGLTVRGHDRNGTEVMQNVLGGDGLLAYTTLCKGDILRNAPVQVMGDHYHVEGFIGRVDRVGPGRRRRRWNHVGLAAHLDDVRSVSPARSFRVERVNGPTFEGRHSIVDKPGLVQRVSMDRNLDIHVVRNRKAAIDGSR